MVRDIIKKYVQDVCKNENNVFGFSFYEQHISVVFDYANELAEVLGANKEIIHLSAYLHDISAILDFSTVKEHNVIGSNIAQGILLQNGYPMAKVQNVKQCIISHSKPMKLGNGSIEEICLSNADAMSKISNPAYWLYFAYCVRKLNFGEGRDWYIKMIDTNWDELIEPAKDLIKDTYYSVRNTL